MLMFRTANLCYWVKYIKRIRYCRSFVYHRVVKWHI